ncbi:MAG: thiamine pyrophosphate-binding protein [Candidatus Staskawiczbacteria bacterium]|nr:thiamine pyrophosphate-binding protein [Candidatus Staskawiczbacteria bacterium]
MRVADYIAKFIYENGTKHVFMFSGGGIMHLTDGLACNKNLKKICVHHEQTASMAIEAYSRLTGKMGVGYFTTGPGATNALTGLAGAWLDSVPCLFISGQAKRKDSVRMAKIPGLRQVGVQEIDIIPVIKSVTKYSAFVDNPNDIKYHLQKAYYFAKEGRPGPVWLDIPLDVQGAEIDEKNLKSFYAPKEKNKISDGDIKKIIKYLKSAKRPVILAGYGVRISGAKSQLSDFAKKYKIPVVTTYLGVDLIEENHACYSGRIGIKGTRSGNLAVQNSDLLIVIASSLPVAEVNYEYSQFARDAKIVVVDIDMSSHKKKTIKIDTLIKGDVKEFLEKLLKNSKKENFDFDKNWLKTCAGWKKKYPVCLPEYKKLKNKINLYYFLEKLSQKLSKNDVVITDAGSVFYVGSQGIKIKKGMRYITSGGLATMGYSLPAGIGASVGLENKRTICITGDGSFQLNIQELQTLVHYKLPVKLFVINNGGYLSIRFTQRKFFNSRFIGVDKNSGISFPNIEKIAKAYGIKFVRAKNNKELGAALDKTLKYKGPVICEIISPENQEIIPAVASEKNPDGAMVSKPLEDMYPFLDREEFKKEMIIKPLKNN